MPIRRRGGDRSFVLCPDKVPLPGGAVTGHQTTRLHGQHADAEVLCLRARPGNRRILWDSREGPAPSSSAAQTVRSPARAYLPRRISWETIFRSQPNRPFSVFGDRAAGRKMLVPEGNDKPSAENRSIIGMVLTSGRTLTWSFYMSSDERLIYEILGYMSKSRTLMRSMY